MHCLRFMVMASFVYTSKWKQNEATWQKQLNKKYSTPRKNVDTKDTNVRNLHNAKITRVFYGCAWLLNKAHYCYKKILLHCSYLCRSSYLCSYIIVLYISFPHKWLLTNVYFQTKKCTHVYVDLWPSHDGDKNHQNNCHWLY